MNPFCNAAKLNRADLIPEEREIRPKIVMGLADGALDSRLKRALDILSENMAAPFRFKFMEEITSQNYPQKAEQDFSSLTCNDQRGPNAFKQGENIPFQRVQTLQSLIANGSSLRLVCNTLSYLNRTCWTHETHLHQLKKVNDAPGEQLNIEITFWSEHVFRVQFGFGNVPNAVPAFPAQAERMLIAEVASSVKLTVEETEGEWIARTGKIALHIEKNPFRLWANDCDGRIFWQQRRSELFTSVIFDMAIAQHASRTACFESFTLDGQEEIFGLGERFDHVPRTGRTVDFWNEHSPQQAAGYSCVI